MKKFWQRVKVFFSPSIDKSFGVKIAPYLTVILMCLILFVVSAFGWEWTNSPSFCGYVCHSMPPQYVTYSLSSHSSTYCVDCHLGRAFIFEQMVRKLGHAKTTGMATILNNFEYPLRAQFMSPADESCELCHSPSSFSYDTFREFNHYASDKSNTRSITYLSLKVGGGSSRQGLGRGIHWHTENNVQYISTDALDQIIPYVRVTSLDGKSVEEYLDVEANFNRSTLKESDLKKVDCITCHNRTSHQILQPEEAIDQLFDRQLASPAIPDFRAKALEALRAKYADSNAAALGISGLRNYYQQYQSEFYAKNSKLVDEAVERLVEIYRNSVFPEQKINWDTYPDNNGHINAPGCFRCHDGKHLSARNESIRLECNICHSVPVKAQPGTVVTNIEINHGIEPSSHKNPNFISMHRNLFDNSCKNCHTVDDPGGSSNKSFCSNSACHGQSWKYAGFDAPKVRQVLQAQLKLLVTPTPQPTKVSGTLSYETVIGPLFANRCATCHGEGGAKGVILTSFSKVMAGGQGGANLIPGKPTESLIIKIQSGAAPHFGQFSPDELELLSKWISNGAPEK
jgi:mono/diheme cytochrome c family protein